MKKILNIGLVFFSAFSFTHAEEPKKIQSHHKINKLSEDAINFYHLTSKQGWAAIVPEFENGNVANSKMTKKEIKKLCDISLTQNKVEDVKRLLAAQCSPSDKNVTFMTINSALKTDQGEIDQQAIIAKLKFFHEKWLLTYEKTYGRGHWATTSTLHVLAVGFGLNQVFDYLNTLPIKIKHNDSNLLTEHFRGRNSNVEMTEKLLKLGYKFDQQGLKILEEKNFINRYPEIVALLKTAT